ncbi:MAG: HIT domain-containing protein [Polyangiaceae bacterium]
MEKPLWAPWRMDYVLGKRQEEGCVFCGVPELAETARGERLVLACNASAYVVLNRYPFTAGHLLVVPHAHVEGLEDLDDEAHGALFRLVRGSVTRLRTAVKAEGFNVGLNLGAVAGAGIAAHLHVHVVPRWAGDTNFMPVLADVRVVPQALEATHAYLRAGFADLDEPRRGSVRPAAAGDPR